MRHASAHTFTWLARCAPLMATALLGFALLPGTAAASGQSAIVSCTITGNATLSPSLAPTGGSGTYQLQAALFACYSSGNYIADSTEFLNSTGTYQYAACGSGTLKGTYTLGSPGHEVVGDITMTSEAGGVGPMSATVTGVDTGPGVGPATGSGTGAVSLEPMTSSPGPTDCADSLTVNGQLTLTFSF